eukprot:CAMPEP_0117444262 /NCGR_PEP_ID=MMETSP0759-20121206/5144_1 /TAXON_ID=63605 /ORGANISM="Percolomonas cosmopolitus, Strain WS" /LENGTH=736 /DNA_ID=CAMNT_0005236311 /DNA_START=90 /DNA_END=2300 /DNA_ORIENTATION=-
MPTLRSNSKKVIDVDEMADSDDNDNDNCGHIAKSKTNTASTSQKNSQVAGKKRKHSKTIDLLDESDKEDAAEPPMKKQKTSAKTSKASKKKSSAAKKATTTKKKVSSKTSTKKKKGGKPDDEEDETNYSDEELDEIIDQTRKSSKATDLWVEKYAPKSSNQIIGHKTQLRVLAFWLQNFRANFVNPKKKKVPTPGDLKSLKQKRLFFETKRNRAVLLSGIAGIGKTTSAHRVCEENGYEVIEWNASDVRSKKQIQERISHTTGNLTLDAFYNPSSRRKLKTKRRKVAIILDEIDGMSSGDRGGISEIIKLIKDTKIPIICIANDARKRNIQTLTKHCLTLSFARPRKDIIQKYLFKICQREKVNIDESTLLHIIESLRNDIRCVLNNLQFMNLHEVQSNKSAETIRKGAEQVNVFQVADAVFRTRERTHNSMMNRYFYDPSLIPLFVQENYPHMRRSAWDDEERLERIFEASEWISEGDLFDMRIRQHQEWQLAPAHAMHSVVAPSYFCHGGFENLRPGDQFIIHFPASLGKGSTTRKNTSLFNMYRHNCSKIATASQTDIVLDYIPMWNSTIGQHLMPSGSRSGEGQIGDVIAYMDEYGLTREDLDTISDLHTFQGAVETDFDFKKVSPQIKSKLTRNYNAASHNVSVAQVLRKEHAPLTMASIVDEEARQNELFHDETKEEDDDPEKKLDSTMAQREVKKPSKKKAPVKRAPAKKSAKPSKKVSVKKQKASHKK